MRVVRRVGVGLLSGVLAGTAAGLLARLMMRLAALATGSPGEFSFAGTAAIVVAFVVFSVPGAVLAALARPWWRWSLLVGSALFLCVPATSIASADLGHVGALTTVQWVGAGAAVVGVYVSILAIPLLTMWLLGGRRSPLQISARVPV